MNDLSFTNQMNWGQGEVRIETLTDVNNIAWCILRIYRTVDTSELIYTWIVGKITHIITESSEYFEVVALGLASILKDILFQYWWVYAFTRAWVDISQIIRDIVDSMNLVYTWLYNYSAATIVNTGITVSVSYLYDNCLEAIVRTAELSEHYWYIDQNWTVYFLPRSWTATTILTLGKDVSNIVTEYDSENIINDYHLSFASGTVNEQSAISIALYWKRSKYEQKTQITSWANDIALAYVLENAFPKQKVTCTVNLNANFFWITPGEVLKIMNMWYIPSLQVQRISYNRNEATIDLESFKSLSKEILK